MLQLQVKEPNIYRISKIFAEHNIKASVANQIITLEGEIPDELLNQLCNEITICKVQNFSDEITTIAQKVSIISEEDEPVSEQIEDKPIVVATNQKIILAPQVIENYDLIYPEVKRGEVYLCDFGEPYGHEIGKERYAIVVQNDGGNLCSPTTIVLPCTTSKKGKWSVHHDFVFSSKNMLDYDVQRVGTKKDVVLAEQIRTVDKTRLRKFLGTMTPEFMDKMQKIMEVSLGFKRKENISELPKERKDLNMVQMRLLALVNIEELFKISQTKDSDEVKSEKILQLFGFDMQKNGVQYLFKAILISPKDAYFNLEIICESISEYETNIEKEEIKRLIVARVKERFKLKKSPTTDFIRLVNCFLTKKEEEQNEENNI